MGQETCYPRIFPTLFDLNRWSSLCPFLQEFRRCFPTSFLVITTYLSIFFASLCFVLWILGLYSIHWFDDGDCGWRLFLGRSEVLGQGICFHLGERNAIWSYRNTGFLRLRHYTGSNPKKWYFTSLKGVLSLYTPAFLGFGRLSSTDFFWERSSRPSLRFSFTTPPLCPWFRPSMNTWGRWARLLEISFFTFLKYAFLRMVLLVTCLFPFVVLKTKSSGFMLINGSILSLITS